ncbi:isoleucine--tRNA ligase [Spiroplasma endosymbiont of Aspidapion aeneum]|uniref:isoleucine--tRNA ligase n=1 Tax=Spiroplasma endosymbiont of Aspidapion aeneum TaxID=3066276 RepID=UPI00313E48A7
MKKDYKDSLNIFNSDFDMRANLVEKEPEFRIKWEEEDIYNLKNKMALESKEKSFILHDGPPYSNGNIHIGHALNKIIKDFIVRWHSSKGEYTPFILGWDNHGLPIESAIEKESLVSKDDVVKFRQVCREYASSQVESQANQFKELGLFTDFSKRYTTLSDEFVLNELQLYKKMVEKKLIIRDYKPIYWSWSSESALAEAEVEYKNILTNTCFVSTKIAKDSNKFAGDSVIIWTTLPWTIAANQAIGINKDITYLKIFNKSDNNRYIISKNLFYNQKLANKFGWDIFNVEDEFLGVELDGIEYEHIWDKRKPNCVIKHADFVTDTAGTGLVGCAGGFGEDDFNFIKSLKKEPFVCVDKKGKFTSNINDERLNGVFIEKASKIVIEHLKETKQLKAVEQISHQFPHDWRTKKPIMFLATHQWFIDIDKYKEEIDKVICRDVKSNVAWNLDKLRNFIKERNSWTISRQRVWGVPIIAFYDKNENILLNSEVVEYAIKVIEEKGVDSWFSLPSDNFLPKKYQGKGYTKETDILDVWFDSGSSAIFIENKFKLPRPYDLFIEGGDQYRGWFNSSIINSVIYDGKSPYLNLASHGMVLDEVGKKMSKSIGNVIEPKKIISQYGTDILRLWAYSINWTEDVRIGNDIIKQVTESYRKIRNTIRFILNNLADFNPNKNIQKNLSEIDNYILSKTESVKREVFELYDLNKFNQAYKILLNFVSNTLSAFYLDFSKDILYVNSLDDLRRRQVQTTIYYQLWVLIDILRPIIPHTIEEVYDSIKNIEKEKSVHLLKIKNTSFSANKDIINKYDVVLKLRNEVNEKLEQAKNNKIVKKGFEAVLLLQIKKEYDFLKTIPDLSQILIVNKINFDKNFLISNDDIISNVIISPAVGEKCIRCWSIVEKLNIDLICHKCEKIVK